MSIDEMACRLAGAESGTFGRCTTVIAGKIKTQIYALAGVEILFDRHRTNVMLAKVAADMQTQRGLTIAQRRRDAAQTLAELQLTDFPGVGPRIERRLKLYGIFTVEQFCLAREDTLEVWGSKLLGERWYRLLHGEEDVPDTPTTTNREPLASSRRNCTRKARMAC